jgi:hypothetical protein
VPQLPAGVLLHKKQAAASFTFSKVSTSEDYLDFSKESVAAVSKEIAKAYWTGNW